MKRSTSVKKQAFTLVELLVVISIIALLLAILMPSLSKAREQAKAAVCRAQLHGWGVAFACYGSENNDLVCAAVSIVGRTYVTWDTSLEPYYKNEKMRLCPSAQNVLPGSNQIEANVYLGSKRGAWDIFGSKGSYGMNVYATKSTEVSERIWSIVPEKCWGKMIVNNASQIPLLGDCMYREVFVETEDVPRPDEIITTEQMKDYYNINQINRYLMRRHARDTINVVFIDGSLKNVHLTDLFKLMWHRKYETKNDVSISWLR